MRVSGVAVHFARHRVCDGVHWRNVDIYAALRYRRRLYGWRSYQWHDADEGTAGGEVVQVVAMQRA